MWFGVGLGELVDQVLAVGDSMGDDLSETAFVLRIIDVEALGDEVGVTLVLGENDRLAKPAPTGDPFAAVLDAAVAGKLTSAKLGELVKASAQTRAAEQLRSELSGRRAASALMQRFSRELLNGAVVAQQGSHALHGFKPIDDGRPEIVAARVVEQVAERHSG